MIPFFLPRLLTLLFLFTDFLIIAKTFVVFGTDLKPVQFVAEEKEEFGADIASRKIYRLQLLLKKRVLAVRSVLIEHQNLITN